MGQKASTQGLHFAAEWGPHQFTYMSWPIGWRSLNSKVQSDITRVAITISQFEPVHMIVPPKHVNQAESMLRDKQIVVVPMPVDDLWARDTLPLFLSDDNKRLVGVNYNFNGWGRKQFHKNDARVASRVLDHLNMTGSRSKLVAEGGAIETDGEGTLLMTESSIVNKNRNPGMSRNEIDQIFKHELGVSKIVWIKGVKDHDITDSHIDSLARFVAPGVVMISRPFPAPADDEESQVWERQYEQAMSVLRQATDAKGRQLRITELPEPNPSKIRQLPPGDIKLCKEVGLDCKNGGLTSYINFYIVNGGIVMPEFGDLEADRHAHDIVQKAFPDRKVVAVNIDYIAMGGGGIHCATHEVPKA
ncbi:hypothetical protein BGZ70_000335 [Mortierella alpina]|uniref:Agmatine deiminase n=1 Tax=Mortierella alpina TaxID=64518 RepID=A0A9P6IY83_MORAP|nr:hypothetical protein BGZ70_000335 [Mortierella alpina]